MGRWTPRVDGAHAAQTLALALAQRTEAKQEPDSQALTPFLQLHEVFRQAYPVFFEEADVQVVAGGSLLMLLPGAQKARPLLFVGHLDIMPVEPGTEELWDFPPFAGAAADGYVWGRGALDMKGHLVALLEAAESLLKAGWRPSTDVWFAFSQDAQIHGPSARQMCRILQAQGVEPSFILDGGGWVEEDFALVGVAEKGYADISLSITSEGGDASLAKQPASLEKLALAAAHAVRHPMPCHLCEPVEWMLRAMSPRFPFWKRVVTSYPKLFWPVINTMVHMGKIPQALFRTTVTLTKAQGSGFSGLISRHNSFTYHCRLLPGDSVEDVIAHLRCAAGPGDIRIAVHSGEKASSVSPAKGAAWDALATAIHILFSESKAVPCLIAKTTEARCYEELSSQIYRFSPFIVQGEGFHKNNEKLSLSNLELGIQFFQQMLQA